MARLATQAQAQGRLQRAHGDGDVVCGFGFPVVAEEPSLFELALCVLEHGSAGSRQAIEQGSRGRHLDPLGRSWAEVVLQDEHTRIGAEQIERALGETWGRIEPVDQHLAELVDLEDVRERPPEGEDGPLELEALVEEHLGDPLLHFGSNRVEEDQDDECRHDDVEEELVARHEAHQP